MDRENDTLLDRIMAFEIDEGPKTLSFASRLARENGWSLAYSRRVIDEYKRFIFLCMEAGHPCTPSDQVDQAWHLHLTYTKSYWERLNGEILPRPLHHNPTEGGTKEDAKFDDWYARTKESYERIFGQVPPSDIWPASEVRFGEDPHAARVNLRRNWVVPKDRVRLAGAGTLVAALLAGCGASDTETAIIAIFAIAGVVALVVLISVLANQGKRNGTRGDGSGGSLGSGCGASCGTGISGGDSSSGCGSSGCGGGGCGGGGCGGGD